MELSTQHQKAEAKKQEATSFRKQDGKAKKMRESCKMLNVKGRRKRHENEKSSCINKKETMPKPKLYVDKSQSRDIMEQDS